MRSRSVMVWAVMVFLVSISGVSFGTTYYVDPCGSDDANGLSWGAAFATIQRGIDAAINSDVVEVNEGSYVENVAFDGNSITLRSTNVNDFNAIGKTIIDGNGTGPPVIFASWEDSNALLIGFTIRNGTDGIFCLNSSSPVISQCLITNNITCGIYSSSSAPPAVKNCWIYKNGKGMEFSSAASVGIVRNNTIVSNTISGVYVGSGTAPAITNCIVWDSNDDLYGCSATYSCVEDGDTGTGNISSYPYFADFEANDFHLTWNSPCMNRGEPYFDPDGETDIDGDCRIIDSRLDIGADEFNSISANLLANPGFEGGNDANGVPQCWTDYPPSTEKMIDANEKHSGSYSWRFSNDTNLLSGGYSDLIAIDVTKIYKLSAWIKCETGDEVVCLGWQLVDNDGNNLTSVVSFVLYYETVATEWTEYVGFYPVTNPAASHVRIWLHGPYKTTGTVWWDDLSLTEVGPEFLPPYGCVNEPNVAETIDFGGGEGSNEHWVSSITHYMTEPDTDSDDDNIDYRELEPHKTLTIDFPAFNVDPNYDPCDPNDLNGLPLTPMLLEVMFKDTTSQGIFVRSRLDYMNLDPNYELDSRYNHPLARLGGYQDYHWKYLQYAFQKNGYQFLRAIHGKFTIDIATWSGGQLPIDYVSLRKITQAEYEALADKQRERRNFHPVDLPIDVPSPPVDYSDPNITVFARDIMHPVYKDTKPGPNEIDANIVGFSVRGQTEPLSFSIYSENGVDDLTVTVSNLIQADSNYVIDGNDIGIYHVVYDETRLGWYAPTGYALLGDRIEEFSTLSVGPNTSERIWLKTRVPDANDGLASGLYEGNVCIKKNGSTKKTVPVKFTIYDIILDMPENINPVYHDPFRGGTILYSSDLDEVLSAYTETGFDPYISNKTHRISISEDTNQPYDVRFDTNKFEQALDRMVGVGFVQDQAILNRYDSEELSDIYKIVFDANYTASDPNLYFKLSDPNFSGAYGLLIEKYMEIGAAKGVSFIFQVTDEPAGDPYKRILTDRLYTIMKDPNLVDPNLAVRTTQTYHTGCNKPVHLDPNDADGKNPKKYKLPSELDYNLPPLINLVDYKVWRMDLAGEGYDNHEDPNYFGDFGYYTTSHSHWRNPVYNRFLHGLFASATDAAVVSAYAMCDYPGDPYNDFDAAAHDPYPVTQPDYLYAYPTWSGELLYTIGGLEAIREGIKDAGYIVTLENLIAEDPNIPEAVEAQAYLEDVKSRIGPDYRNYYKPQHRPAIGYYERILKNVSEDGDPNDFEAFTTIRKKIADYILLLSGVSSDINDDGIVNFVDFAILAYHWMDNTCEEPHWCEGSDIDKSDIVDFTDLRIFTDNWLASFE